MKASPLALCKSGRGANCVFTGISREEERVRRGGKRWQGTQATEAAGQGQGVSKRERGERECGPERQLALAQATPPSQCFGVKHLTSTFLSHLQSRRMGENPS